MFVELLLIFLIIGGILGSGFAVRFMAIGLYELIKDRQYKALAVLFFLIFLLVLCGLAIAETIVMGL